MEQHNSEQIPKRVREHLFPSQELFWERVYVKAGSHFLLYEGIGIGMPSLSHTHLTPGLHPSFVLLGRVKPAAWYVS